MGSGIKVLSNPFALIGMLIGISILASMATTLFPSIVASLVTLSTLGNFSFGSFFETGGVLILILSAIILLTILAVFGVKGLGGGR